MKEMFPHTRKYLSDLFTDVVKKVMQTTKTFVKEFKELHEEARIDYEKKKAAKEAKK